MKKIYTIITYLLLTLYCPSTLIIANSTQNYTVSIAPFSYKVLKRFYLIERLRKTMNVIAEIKEQIDQCAFLAGHNSIPAKNHSITLLNNTTRTLRPLFMLWEDFSNYKKLNDELFVEEFTREVFVVVKFKLLNDLHKSKLQTKAFCSNFDFVDHVSINTRIDIIAAIGNFLKDETITLHHLHDEIQSIIARQKKRFNDIPKNIESEHILQRLYLIERLRNQTTFLQCFKQLNLNIFKKTDFKNKKFKKREFDDQIIFHDHRIQTTIKKMIQTNSLDPLILLLENFYEFVHIDNAEFIRETLITLFITQKNILMNHLPETKDAGTVIIQIVHLYNLINSLPIEEILNAIDTLTDALEDVAHEIEAQSPTTSWWSRSVTAMKYLVNAVTSFSL